IGVMSVPPEALATLIFDEISDGP
ncbi:MAG: hypothetical protein QOF74_1065, partial [Caballeronia mineralivorans]|nr:hypothetical protein [Caballeronia mineralivorans]